MTLTPPLANAMLMAARASGNGWTYDEANRTLTITHDVSSSQINGVTFDTITITIDESAPFTNDMTLTNCTINVSHGQFINQGRRR